MNSPWHWSPLQPGLEALSPTLSVPTATAWRRCRGFAERLAQGMEVGECAHLHPVREWMSTLESDLRLHLVIKVGGAHKSAVWLGVGAAGYRREVAESRAREVASDLGEALDAWELFQDVPSRGPQIRSKALGLTLPEGSQGKPPLQQSRAQPALLGAMGQLAKRRTPLAISIEFRPRGGEASTVEELDRIRSRIRQSEQQRPDGDGFLFLLFDPVAEQTRALKARVRGLRQQATAGELRIRLHGQPPNRLLGGVLLRALERDLGLPVAFERTAPQPVTAWNRPLAAVLGVLAAGTDAMPEGPPDRRELMRRMRDRDIIPF